MKSSSKKAWVKSKKKRQPGKNNYQDRFAEAEIEKGRREVEDGKFGMPRSRTSNDPQWYFKDQNVLKDVASYSFQKALGTRMKDVERMFGRKMSQAYSTIPGLMTISLAPTPGISENAQSPINLAAQAIYWKIRYENSGAKNYDPTDLMMYLLAMDSVYSCWNWIKRVYGLANKYSQMNKYQPLAYMEANNIDFNDVMNNLADFRAYINLAAQRISSFCVPAVFNLMVRHSWLYSNVYKDSETIKAQEYMYVPAWFYQFDETTELTGTSLSPVPVLYPQPSKKYKVSDLSSMLNGMINRLQYSEDAGTMSGDILKAFRSNLFTLTTITADYVIEPVYNKEVLTQIENAQYLGFAPFVKWNETNLNIVQDPNTNWIKFKPVFKVTTSVGGPAGNFLNFHWDNPTPEDVIVASRLNCVLSEYETDGVGYKLSLLDCGSEFAVDCNIWVFSEGSSASIAGNDSELKLRKVPVQTVAINVGDTSVETVATYINMIAMVNAFDWSPMVYVAYNPGGIGVPIPPIRDWCVYTYIDDGDIAAMNEMALLSLLNIPAN